MKSYKTPLISAALVLAAMGGSAAMAQSVKPPSAVVQNIFAFGERAARAELVIDGRVVTVQPGDEVQGWTVGAISPQGVVMTRTDMQADPLKGGRAKVGAARSARDSGAWFAPADPSLSRDGRMVEFTQTYKLRSAIENGAVGNNRGPMSAISIQ